MAKIFSSLTKDINLQMAKLNKPQVTKLRQNKENHTKGYRVKLLKAKKKGKKFKTARVGKKRHITCKRNNCKADNKPKDGRITDSSKY